MFKNRSMQVKMVKDQAITTQQMLDIDPEKINTIVKESVKTIALGIVVVFGSMTVIKTASEVVINYAPKN